jgi:site-specific recombinase XerD
MRNYRHDIESFASWCATNSNTPIEEFDPTKVTADDIREWIIHRMDLCKISAASMNRELSSLRSFYKYLRRQNIFSQDIFCKISALRTSHKLPAFVSETRMEQLLDNIRENSQESDFRKQRNALIVALLKHSVKRAFEEADRRFPQIDYEELIEINSFKQPVFFSEIREKGISKDEYMMIVDEYKRWKNK